MYLIADNVDTRTGLRLAGIDGALAHTREELIKELEKARSDKNIGIIIIMEKLAEKYNEIIEEFKNTYRQPLLVEIPDRHGTARQKDFLSRYIREAIGIKMG